MSDKHYIGVSGFPGLHANPFTHIKLYARQFAKLGIALGHLGHDAATCLVQDGRLRFAVEEERLNRHKHYMGFPEEGPRLLLAQYPEVSSTPCWSYYLNLSEDNLLERIRSSKCSDDLAKEMAREYNAVGASVRKGLARWPSPNLVDHHVSHAASAFYCSGFERSLVVVADGQGEHSSLSVFEGYPDRLKLVETHGIASSLGILYAAITAYLGFEPVEDEYKVMGLAAYGSSDSFRQFFESIMTLDQKGHLVIPSLLKPPMHRLAEWERALGSPRDPSSPIESRHIEIAFSLQSFVERTILAMLERHALTSGLRHLCLAGGLALNCSMNGAIDRAAIFDEIFVQPAAGDPGAAAGAALATFFSEHPEHARERVPHVYLGPGFTEAQITQAIARHGHELVVTNLPDLTEKTSSLLAEGKVIGWFQGRMEFGPRALGNRSILADPRRPEMKDRVNHMVKKREEFRPFAPSVTLESADNFFELRRKAQYEFMTIAVPVKVDQRTQIPSVVHVNGTSRVQIVRKEVNPIYWRLLKRFGEKTGVPVLLNTSFNVRGEPIVCSPNDAIRCFLDTNLDALVIHDYLLHKRSHFSRATDASAMPVQNE